MTVGAAKCATGKGGAKCATGKGWAGSCTYYLLARKCSDRTVSIVGMTTTDAATIGTQSFKLSGVCYYFNFADSFTSTVPTTLTTPGAVTTYTDCFGCNPSLCTCANGPSSFLLSWPAGSWGWGPAAPVCSGTVVTSLTMVRNTVTGSGDCKYINSQYDNSSQFGNLLCIGGEDCYAIQVNHSGTTWQARFFRYSHAVSSGVGNVDFELSGDICHPLGTYPYARTGIVTTSSPPASVVAS